MLLFYKGTILFLYAIIFEARIFFSLPPTTLYI